MNKKNLVDMNEGFCIKTRNGETHTLKYPNEGQLELFEIQKKRNMEMKQDGSIKHSDPKSRVATVWLYDLLFVKATDQEGKEIKKEKVSILMKDAVAMTLWKNIILDPSEVVEIFGTDSVKPESIPGLFYLKVFHNSQKTLTIHQMKEPQLSHFEEWKLLNESEKEKVKKNKVVYISKNKVLRKIKLYDELFVTATGYVSLQKEDIPGTHKLEIVEELFSVTASEVLDLD